MVQLSWGLLILASLFGYGMADVQCPLGWLAGDSSCYLFGHYRVTFVEAESFCRLHKGYLVELNSPHESNFIKDRLRAMKGNHWWLGITDETIEGEWRLFENGDLTNFTDWGPSEPEPQKDEDCAMFNVESDFAWADVKCTNNDVVPLCEKPATSADQECLTQIIG